MKELLTKPASRDLKSGITDGEALLQLARGWLQQGNPVVAIDLLKSAITSREAEHDEQLRASILKETGRDHMMQSEWDLAESYYLEAQRVFKGLDDFQGAAECARNRANAFFQQGEYGKSEKLCQLALQWATDISNYQLRATILNTLGAIKSATGDQREAIKVLKLCLADFESSGNSIRQGYVLLNMGLAFTELGEYSEAIESLNQSLSIALTEKDLNLVEICYQNTAKCYFAQKQTSLAKSVINTARKILPGLNSIALTTELNVIDCRILRAMGQIQAAEKLLAETGRMARENNLLALEAEVLFEQGQLNKDTGETGMAYVQLDASANLFRQVGLDKQFQVAIQTLNQLKSRMDE